VRVRGVPCFGLQASLFNNYVNFQALPFLEAGDVVQVVFEVGDIVGAFWEQTMLLHEFRAIVSSFIPYMILKTVKSFFIWFSEKIPATSCQWVIGVRTCHSII